MTAHTLCDTGLQVLLTRRGELASIEIRDGTSVVFECYVDMIREVLRGVPMQASNERGYCHVQLLDARVRLEFALRGSGRRTCDISVGTLVEAMDSSAE
jgi:hypothetical protein